MEIGSTLIVSSPKQWRFWLEKNHALELDIWLILYKNTSGKKSISYEDAVCEALCFGWIDSIEKSMDAERFAQRFSPRLPESILSDSNRIWIDKLIASNKMTQAGLLAVEHVL